MKRRRVRCRVCGKLTAADRPCKCSPAVVQLAAMLGAAGYSVTSRIGNPLTAWRLRRRKAKR